MDPMLSLVVACTAFLALHVLPSTPLRAALIARLGEGPYSGLFSLATLGAIVWMALAYRAAPLAFLWPGLRHLPSAVMPFSFILIACGVLTPNPTAVAARQAARAPESGAGHHPRHAPPRDVGHHAVGRRAHPGARRAQGDDLLRHLPPARRRRHAAAGHAQGENSRRGLAALRRAHLERPVRRHRAGPQPLRRATRSGW